MLTKDVREWLQKVERKQYSYEDAMYEFVRFSPYLTIQEMKQLKNRAFSKWMKKNKTKTQQSVIYKKVTANIKLKIV